jgi:hypothetical protein
VNLPEEVQQQLAQVVGGPPFPWGWLATFDAQSGARVRTVRLLSYNLRTGLFHFASHRDHAKHQQMRLDPRGQLCLLRNEPLLQIRLDVRLRSGPAADFPQGPRFWERLPGPERLRLYQAHPQAPTPADTFWVVEAQTEALECLDLGLEASRVKWTKGTQGWSKLDSSL